MLNIETVSDYDDEWSYFKSNFLASRIWLEPHPNPNKGTLFTDLLESVIDPQLTVKQRVLSDEMATAISQFSNDWKAITTFEYKNANFNSKFSFRNDSILNGLEYELDSDAMEAMKRSLSQSDGDALSKVCDSGVYLNRLVLRAYRINPYFQSYLATVLQPMVASGAVTELRRGPVKRIERCAAKAAMDYNRSEGYQWPSSTHIIDSIRASAVCRDLKSYIGVVEYLRKYFETHANDDDSEQCVITQIVRIKNQFYNYDKPTFNGYKDIKFNVVASYRRQSVIAEIQLICAPMIAIKKCTHELYEIKRVKDVFTQTADIEALLTPTVAINFAVNTDNILSFV